MFDDDEILAFLHFGYLPQVTEDVKHQAWTRIRTLVLDNIGKDGNEVGLVTQGVRALKSAFRNPGGDTHIIPLSGGLDSRAILGGLLEAGLKDQITTVTFGSPGTFDFDIGCDMARKIGVHHECIDLTQVRLTQELLEKTAQEVGMQVWSFDAYYNRLICERFGRDTTYWSGFMGDPLAGSHLLPESSKTWDIALSRFVSRNRFSRSIDLTAPGFDPKDVLPQSPIFENTRLSYDDQLDFAIRQQSYIRVVVLPGGYDYRTPFLHPDWVDFILSVPRRYRENMYLYKEILKQAYPKLFSFPTKTNLGLPLSAPHWREQLRRISLRASSVAKRFLLNGPWGVQPRLNYIDFDQGLRKREDLKTIVYQNLQDLKHRGVVDWIDIDAIWDRHQRKLGNHADALTLLASLEINLKVQVRLI